VLNARKFDRGLGQILHDQQLWLDVPDRVLFKLAVTVHQCLNGRAPPYLSEHCITVSSADTRRPLRSANRHLVAVPCFRLNTGRQAFSVSGPDCLELSPGFYPGSDDCFRCLLKTYLFAHQGFLTIMRCTNPRTHSLTSTVKTEICNLRSLLFHIVYFI